MKRLALSLLLLLGLVLAQAIPKATTTVAQIRAKPVNSQRVILTGQIVSRSGDNDYRFADLSGEIAVGVGSRKPLELSLGVKVTLEGQVDLNPLGELEIDLLRVWLPDGRVLVLPRG